MRKKKEIDRQRNREGLTLRESKRKRDRQTYRHTDRHAYVKKSKRKKETHAHRVNDIVVKIIERRERRKSIRRTKKCRE